MLCVAIGGGTRIVVFNVSGAVQKEIPMPLSGTPNLASVDHEILLVTGVYDISGAPFVSQVIEIKLG